ncbi:hypothetical protein EI94DRAFT_1746079 [Lactarius quietus]|nr:hypothetical protein EI94DRAFT_1746079 [Lactarius quietus]
MQYFSFLPAASYRYPNHPVYLHVASTAFTLGATKNRSRKAKQWLTKRVSLSPSFSLRYFYFYVVTLRCVICNCIFLPCSTVNPCMQHF